MLPRPRISRSVALATLAFVVLALDVAFASRLTAVAAVTVMVGLLAYPARGAAALARHAASGVRLRSVLRFEAVLLFANAGVLLARLFIAVEQWRGPGALDAPRAAARTYDVLFVALFVCALTFLVATERVARLALAVARRPAALLAGSFAALIATSTLLLALPISVQRVTDISFVDALFTATSAVCVTGLVVNDVAATYTLFGQVVILLSIQLGGIGIMTIAALALTTSRKGSLQAESRYASMMEASNLLELRVIVRSVVAWTFWIEAVGTLLLWALWAGDPRLGGRSALFAAVFHAVSAFCNAGFALFPANLEPFVRDPLVQVVLMVLIVLGGLGFLALRDVGQHLRDRARARLWPKAPRARRLRLGTRTSLVTSFALVAVGAATCLVLETTGVLFALRPDHQILNALFLSVTSRTAGFNTIPIGELRDATLLCVMVLMFIGGSPGSTAGGVKTTTFAVIVAALRGELRGREPHLFGRALEPDALRKATAVVAISAGIVVSSLLLLTLTERQPLSRLAFEAVSAFGTVGLSTGITPTLTWMGKLVLVATMFVGRVGPLTVALAVARERRREPFRLAHEHIPVG